MAIVDSTWVVVKAKCPKCNSLKLDKLVIEHGGQEWALAYRCQRCALFDGEEVEVSGKRKLVLQERPYNPRSLEERYSGKKFEVPLES